MEVYIVGPMGWMGGVGMEPPRYFFRHCWCTTTSSYIIRFRHRLLLLLPAATTSAATSFSFLFSRSRIIRRRIVPPSSSSHNAMSCSNNHEFEDGDVLQVKFLSNNAIMPRRGSPHAAGFDLSASEATVVPAGGRVVVKTDLCMLVRWGHMHVLPLVGK
jgi:hypothetical protein